MLTQHLLTTTISVFMISISYQIMFLLFISFDFFHRNWKYLIFFCFRLNIFKSKVSHLRLIVSKKWNFICDASRNLVPFVQICTTFVQHLYNTEKMKNSILEIPRIPQTLNINNSRPTNAKSINLHTIRKLVEYSLKTFS